MKLRIPVWFLGLALLGTACSPAKKQGMSETDRVLLREFCECAAPYAALTLMVMMEDSANANIDSLEKELALLSLSYAQCQILISDIEAKSQKDSTYQNSVVGFVKDSLPNCSLLILGEQEG